MGKNGENWGWPPPPQEVPVFSHTPALVRTHNAGSVRVILRSRVRSSTVGVIFVSFEDKQWAIILSLLGSVWAGFFTIY